MANFNQGILGGFSGKVGTVVGYYQNGRYIMRGLAQSHNDANSEAQQEQRSKFSLSVSWLKPINGYLRYSYKSYASSADMSCFNAALKSLMTEAVAGTYPDNYIDPMAVSLSSGSLIAPTNAAATSESNTVTFTWTDNTGTNDASADDIVYPLCYNIEGKEAIYDITGSTLRSDGQATLVLPSDWAGDTVYNYLVVTNSAGSSSSKTLCLGSLSL